MEVGGVEGLPGPGPGEQPVFDGAGEVFDPGALPPGPDDVHPEPGDAERPALAMAAALPAPAATSTELLPSDEQELASPPPGGYLDVPDEPDDLALLGEPGDEDPALPESSFRPDSPEEI